MREERKTLTRYTIESEHRHPGSTGDFSGLLNAVATAVKIISNQVGRGALVGALGSAGVENVQGEVQKKLDLISNEVMIGETEWTGHLAAMASEEMEDIYPVPATDRRGKYLLVFDPLDGSSNIDANISVGTIFSILRSPDPGAEPRVEHFLQPGAAQVCAGFALYGPSHDADPHHRRRRRRIHARSRHRGVRPHSSAAAHPRGLRGVRDQRLQRALLGAAGAPLHPGVPGRQDRTARPGLQHALDRLAGGRDVPHPHPRRRLPVPQGQQGTGQARAAAADVRVQSDLLHRRAGRRRRQHRTRARHGNPAREPAPARAADPRIQERGRADRALPPRPGQRTGVRLRRLALQQPFPVPDP